MDALRSESLGWSESVLVIMIQALSTRLLSAFAVLWLRHHTTTVCCCTALSKGSILPLERIPLICHIESVWLLLVLLLMKLLMKLLLKLLLKLLRKLLRTLQKKRL